MIRLLLPLIMMSIIAPAIAVASQQVVVFAGSASQPPLEEAAQTFQDKTGIPIILHLGGSGAMLNQMQLTGQGDVYIPGSPDYMQKAVELGLVEEEPATVAYLVPALIVAKGNPLEINSLEDLTRENLRIGLADPDGVCVGLYAIEILYANNLLQKIRANLKGMVESCAKAASMIPLNMVDVVLGWREFAAWQPHTMDTVLPHPEEIPRLAFIPGAAIKSSKNRKGADAFLAFLTSQEGQAIFRKWGYLTTENEVRQFAPEAAIGGTFPISEVW